MSYSFSSQTPGSPSTNQFIEDWRKLYKSKSSPPVGEQNAWASKGILAYAENRLKTAETSPMLQKPNHVHWAQCQLDHDRKILDRARDIFAPC